MAPSAAGLPLIGGPGGLPLRVAGLPLVGGLPLRIAGLPLICGLPLIGGNPALACLLLSGA
jgi:hypothetical protein